MNIVPNVLWISVNGRDCGITVGRIWAMTLELEACLVMVSSPTIKLRLCVVLILCNAIESTFL